MAVFLSQIKGESSAKEFLEGEKEQHGIYAIDDFYERLREYAEGKKKGRYSSMVYTSYAKLLSFE